MKIWQLLVVTTSFLASLNVQAASVSSRVCDWLAKEKLISLNQESIDVGFGWGLDGYAFGAGKCNVNFMFGSGQTRSFKGTCVSGKEDIIFYAGFGSMTCHVGGGTGTYYARGSNQRISMKLDSETSYKFEGEYSVSGSFTTNETPFEVSLSEMTTQLGDHGELIIVSKSSDSDSQYLHTFKFYSVPEKSAAGKVVNEVGFDRNWQFYRNIFR